MSDPNKQQTPPTTPAKKEKKVVWMACRANGSGCGSNQAYAVFSKAQPIQNGGGTSYRYRCIKCNGVWHLTR